MGDAPLWQTIPLYALGLLAAAGVLFVVVLLAVRVALRPLLEQQRTAARRQEALLREISGSAEYVADVADAWAEREADSGRTAVTGRTPTMTHRPSEPPEPVGAGRAAGAAGEVGPGALSRPGAEQATATPGA